MPREHRIRIVLKREDIWRRCLRKSRVPRRAEEPRARSTGRPGNGQLFLVRSSRRRRLFIGQGPPSVGSRGFEVGGRGGRGGGGGGGGIKARLASSREVGWL
jgi:hypothetical protein